MYRVSSTQLNIRTSPDATNNRTDNLHASLQNGHIVEKLADTEKVEWWKVSTILQGTEFIGYVNNTFLTQVDNFHTQSSISEVHLAKTNLNAKLSSTSSLAHPLNEQNMPSRSETSQTEKVNSILAIINWLNVENSPRYLPRSATTYCNIYAYDFCMLNNVYIPRVWWSQNAIIKLNNGDSVPVSYGNTVFEKNANSLHDWFLEWGNKFGWERVATMSALQQRANEGFVCILVARRRDTNRSGHIVAVVPENGNNRAIRDGAGIVTVPLQSQAGATNKKFTAN